MACFESLDTVALIGFFFGILSFIITFNVEGMPWIPYPLTGNIQDVNPDSLPEYWEQGSVLVILLWGVSYIRKSILVILKQTYLINLAKLKDKRDNSETARIGKRYYETGINNNVDVFVVHDARYRADTRSSPKQHHSTAASNTISEPSPDASVGKYLVAALVYHTFFGVWIGWACNTRDPIQYRSSDTEWLVVGLLVWLAAETIILTKFIILYKKENLFDSRWGRLFLVYKSA